MAAAGAYPVRVDASLDPSLSRWLWIFKGVLGIPHFIVLAFLWVAFIAMSVIAFFAILFTGRYPRSIFDFNVGVLRWTWRVAYYAYSALGTDEYLPFTLEDVPGYPAHLEIEYPDHLSRGLVLVKWWLLAIPQYIIVGLFVGSGALATSYFGNFGLPLEWFGARTGCASRPGGRLGGTDGAVNSRRSLEATTISAGHNMRWRCKTVGFAFGGSNPPPATTCENGPSAADSRLCGPFSFVPWCVIS